MLLDQPWQLATVSCLRDSVEAPWAWKIFPFPCPDQQQDKKKKKNPLFSRFFFIAHMVKTYQMVWALKDNLVWTIFPSKKSVVLWLSTKSYCCVQGGTVGGPFSGGMGLRQGGGVPRPVCAAWMQKAKAAGESWVKLQVWSRKWTPRELASLEPHMLAEFLAGGYLSALLFRVLGSWANRFSVLGQPSLKNKRKEKKETKLKWFTIWVSVKWWVWIADNFSTCSK